MPFARATSGGRSEVESVTTRTRSSGSSRVTIPISRNPRRSRTTSPSVAAGMASSSRPTVTQPGKSASISCWRGVKRDSKKAGPRWTRARARGSGASCTRSSSARKISEVRSCWISLSTPPFAGRSWIQNGPASSRPRRRNAFTPLARPAATERISPPSSTTSPSAHTTRPVRRTRWTVRINSRNGRSAKSPTSESTSASGSTPISRPRSTRWMRRTKSPEDRPSSGRKSTSSGSSRPSSSLRPSRRSVCRAAKRKPSAPWASSAGMTTIPGPSVAA